MIKGTFKSAFGEVLFKPKKGSEGCAVPKGNRRIIDTKPEQAYSLLFNEIMRFHGNSMVFHPRRGESWGGGPWCSYIPRMMIMVCNSSHSMSPWQSHLVERASVMWE